MRRKEGRAGAAYPEGRGGMPEEGLGPLAGGHIKEVGGEKIHVRYHT